MANPDSTNTVHRAVVSGATGFIGRRLVASLERQGIQIVALVRDAGKANRFWAGTTIGWRQVDFSANKDIGAVCEGADTVFHLAGYAHAEDANDDANSTVHQTVTVEGTRALVNAAMRARVRHFVFVSSVKVIGEGSDCRLDENSPIAPTTAYGRAKHEAEKIVLETGARHGMHVAVLRLPIVYGFGHKGNLARMIAGIARGWFPPLPEVHNKRSLVHADDVVQAMCFAAKNPRANGEVYLVTDGRAYSTHHICVLIRHALGKAEPNWKVPLSLLEVAARMGDTVGRVRGRPFFFNSVTLNKLLGSAWYSSEKIERDLGFKPKQTLETALPEMVDEYRT